MRSNLLYKELRGNPIRNGAQCNLLWKEAKCNLYSESYAGYHILKLMFGKIIMEGIRRLYMESLSSFYIIRATIGNSSMIPFAKLTGRFPLQRITLQLIYFIDLCCLILYLTSYA